MGDISITYEGKETLKTIQDKFRSNLSEKEILKTTAFALNTTARRAQTVAKKAIKENYKIKNKYLDRISKLTKFAKGTPNGLYSELSYDYGTIPIIAFDAKQTGKNTVSVTIKKGKTVTQKRSYIRTMKSGHTGVFSIGAYKGGKWIPNAKGARGGRFTQINTASPFTMAMSKESSQVVKKMVEEQLPTRLQAMLLNKLNKMNSKK